MDAREMFFREEMLNLFIFLLPLLLAERQLMMNL
jgi:hypothetical protein